MNIGNYGLQAARAYQALPQNQKRSATVQYAPSPEKSAFNLFQYIRAFEQDGKPGSGYSAKEIAAMSGLDLSGLRDPKQIERLWDRDQNGQVDDKEAFTGMALLDLADGQFDGKITQAGRENTENYGLGYSASRQKRPNLAETLTPEMKALLKDIPGSDKLLEKHERQLAQNTDATIGRQVDDIQVGYRQNLNNAAIGTKVDQRYYDFLRALTGQ